MYIESRRARRASVAASLGLVASGAALIAGCPGRLEDIDRYRPKDAGVAECPDIPETFVARCGQDVCHGSMNKAGLLDLASPGLEERLTTQKSKGCSGTLADPADPEASLLYTKLAESMPACGLRMPLGADPFSPHDLSCVKAWIAELEAPPPEDAGCEKCICTPGAVESCYSGPEGTAGVGICKAGTRTCNPEGLTWGPCEGEVLPAPEEQCLTPEDDNCDGDAPPCPSAWSKAWGDALTQYARGVAVDATGNVYVTGDFEGTVDFGGGPLTATSDKSDVFVLKLDQYGNHLWSHRFGDESNQYAGGIAVDAAGAVFLTGRAFGIIDFGGGPLDGAALDDVYVAKLDTNGKHVWSGLFGDNGAQRGDRVAVDGSGNPVFVGQFAGSIKAGGKTITSAGAGDGFALKLDGKAGAPLWAAHIGGAGDDQAQGVAFDAQGNTFVVGRFSGTADAGGVALTSEGGTDAFIAKISPAGAVTWAKGFGGTGADQAYDVGVDPTNGQPVLVGAFTTTIQLGGELITSAGARDIFVGRLDGDGGHVWSKGFGDATDQLTGDVETNTRLSIAVDAQGQSVFGGPFSGSADFGGGVVKSAGKLDVLLVWLGKGGEHVASKAYGNAGTQFGIDVATDGEHAFVVGRFYTSINFGFGSHQAVGDSDAFVAKVKP